jgi:tRNA pseudouridine55 synthase
VSRDRSPEAASGILLVDKPGGWTSHDVVARTRRLAGTRKVGHAGTLDPMATGLLVLGVGASTRLLTYLVGSDKEYLATIRLGQATVTDDAEGEITASADEADVRALTAGAVRAAITPLTGRIDQVPSAVSAIKVNGERAYARVRGGEDVTLAARAVTVAAFDVLELRNVDDPPSLDLDVRIACSSGTYVRALARDLGANLGVGGHLTALRRTRVGPFPVADAAPLDELDVAASLMPPAAAASRLFERVDLSEQQAIDLGHGKTLAAPATTPPVGPIAAIAPDGRLVGLVEARGNRLKSLVNFPADQKGRAQ